MASIFTVRDKEGNIIEIPALQGPPGADGKQGPQGERGLVGPGGVYVGADEFPEEYAVQIDPNGDVAANIPVPADEDIGRALVVNSEGEYGFASVLTTVDDTVTEGSTNPVSSAAVAAYVAAQIAAIPNYNEVSV